MARIVCDLGVPPRILISIFILSLFILINIIALAIPPYSDLHTVLWICPIFNLVFFVGLIISLLLYPKWWTDSGAACMSLICSAFFIFVFVVLYLLLPMILFGSEEVEEMSSGSKFKYFFDKYNFKFINFMFYPFLVALFCAIGILAIILWIFRTLYKNINCCHIERDEDTDVERGESVKNQKKATKDRTSQRETNDCTSQRETNYCTSQGETNNCTSQGETNVPLPPSYDDTNAPVYSE
jgi:hypothetical protein